MKRSPGATGFRSHDAPVASSRLTDAVAAALALGALSLCVIVCFTMLATKAGTAVPPLGV
jgi:hypothetical protein